MNEFDDLFLTEEEKTKKQQAQKKGEFDDLFGEPDSGWDYGGPENPSVPSGSDFAGVKPIEAGTATVGFMGGTVGTTKPSLPPMASREAIAARAREQAAREAMINTITTVGAVLQPFQSIQDLSNSLVLGYRWATTGNDKYLKYAQQGLGQAFGHLTWGAAERIPGLEDLRKNDIYAAKVFEGTSLAKNKNFLLAWDILADPSLLLTLGAGSIKVAANAVGTLSKVERAVVVEKMLATADKMNALSNAITLAPFKASTQLLNTMGSMAVQDVGLLQDVLGNIGKRGAEFGDLERATGGMPTPRYDALSGKSLLEMGGDAVKGALKKTLPTDFPLKSIPLFGPLVQQELTRVAAGKTRVKLYDALLTPEAKYKLYADDPDELARIMARDRIFLESFDAMDEMRAMKIEAVNKIKPLMDALPASLRPQANEALGRLASSTASTVEEAMLDLGSFFQKADPSIRDGQFLDAFKQMAQVRHDLGVKLREVNQPTVINDDALATVLNAKTLDDVLPSFEMLTSRTIRLRGAEDRAALRGMQKDLLEQTQMVVGMGHAKGAVPASVLAPLRVKQSEKLNNLDDAFLRVLNDIEAKGTDLQKESFLNVAKNYVAGRQGIMNNLEGRGIQTASDPTALEILGDATSLSDFAATFKLMVTKQGMEAPWLVRSYFGKSGNPEQLEELREATVKAINTPEGQRVTTVTDELTPSIEQAQKDLELAEPVRPTPAALQGEVNAEAPKFGDPRDAVVSGRELGTVYHGTPYASFDKLKMVNKRGSTQGRFYALQERDAKNFAESGYNDLEFWNQKGLDGSLDDILFEQTDKKIMFNEDFARDLEGQGYQFYARGVDDKILPVKAEEVQGLFDGGYDPYQIFMTPKGIRPHIDEEILNGNFLDLRQKTDKLSPELLSRLKNGSERDNELYGSLMVMQAAKKHNALIEQASSLRTQIQDLEAKFGGSLPLNNPEYRVLKDQLDLTQLELRNLGKQLESTVGKGPAGHKVQQALRQNDIKWTPEYDIHHRSPALIAYMKEKGYSGYIADDAYNPYGYNRYESLFVINNKSLMTRENAYDKMFADLGVTLPKAQRDLYKAALKGLPSGDADVFMHVAQGQKGWWSLEQLSADDLDKIRELAKMDDNLSLQYSRDMRNGDKLPTLVNDSVILQRVMDNASDPIFAPLAGKQDLTVGDVYAEMRRLQDEAKKAGSTIEALEPYWRMQGILGGVSREGVDNFVAMMKPGADRSLGLPFQHVIQGKYVFRDRPDAPWIEPSKKLQGELDLLKNPNAFKLPKPKLPDGIDPKETEVVTRVIKRQARILTDMDRNDLDISLAKNGKDVDELRKTYLKYGLTLPPVEYIKDPVTGAVTVAWKNINAAGNLNAPRAAVSLDIPVDDPIVQRFLRESDVDQYVQDNASKLVMGEKKTREATPRGFDPNIHGDVQTYLREVGRQQQEYDDFFENIFAANSAELADLAARAGVKPNLPDSNKPLRVFGDDTLDHYIPKTTVGYELAGARFVRRVEELGLKASKQEIAEYKRQMAAYNKWMKLKTVQPEELVTHLKDYYTVHPQATVLDGVISLAKNFDFGRKDMLRYLHSVLAAAEKGFEQKFSAFEELGLIAKEGKKLEPSFRGASGTERLRSQGQKLTRLHNQTFKREVDALGLLQKQVDRAGAQYVRAKTVQSWFQFANDTGEYLPAESVKRILTAPEDTLTEAERAIRIEVQGSRVAEAGRTPLAALEGWREVTSEMVQMSGGKFKKGDHVSAEVYNDLLIASATDDVVAQSYLLDQFGGLSRFLRAWKAGALGSIKSVFNETMGNFLNMGLSGYDPLDLIRGVRELNRMNPDELAQLNKGLGGAQLQNVERLASTQYEGMLRQAESWYRADRKQTALGAALDHYLSWFEVMTGANPHALAGTAGGGLAKGLAEASGLGQSYVFRARSWLSDRQRLLLAATVKAKNPKMPIADVIDETNKVLFDYRLAPLYARVLSRTGIRPFASFEAFSGQRLVLLMMQNPAPYVRFNRVPGAVDRYWMQDEKGEERVPAERLTMRKYERGSIRVFELDNGEGVYFNPQYLDPLGAPNAIADWSGTSVGIYDMGPFIGWGTAIMNGQGRYGVNPYDEILQGQPGGFREAAQTDLKRAIEIAAQTTLNFINPAFVPGSSKGSKFADSVVHAATLPNDGSIDVSFSKMMVGTPWGREVLKFLKYGPARIVTGGELKDTSPSPYGVEAQKPSMAALGLNVPVFGVKGLSGDKGDHPPVDLQGKFMPGNYQSRGTQKLLVDQRQVMDELRRLWSNYHRFANPNINSPAAIQREYWETTLKQDRIVNRYLGTVEILLPSKGFLGQQKNLLESIERQAQGQ